MRFGLRYANTGPYAHPDKAVELLRAAEDVGFESAWTVEHTVLPRGYESTYPYTDDGRMAVDIESVPIPDPLIWMSYVASATRSILLGSAVIVLPQHSPVVLAKQVATLDHLSGGRVILGIGVGWLKEEFDAIGVTFANRGRRTDEYIDVLRELWSSPSPTFKGEFIEFSDCYFNPKPVGGTVPIVIGGDSEAAARRAGRLGDGYFPARGAPTHLIQVAREAAERAGRDPDALQITVSYPDDEGDLERLAAAGVSRVVVPVTSSGGLEARVGGPDDLAAWSDRIQAYATL